MGSVYDIVSALQAMGAELQAVAGDADEASKAVEHYKEVEAAASSSEMADMNPNRDRSRDMGSSSGESSGQSGINTSALAAALKAVR